MGSAKAGESKFHVCGFMMTLQSEECAMANRSAAAKKAAQTRKHRAVGKKAARTRKLRAAGRKAAGARTLKKEQSAPAPATFPTASQLAPQASDAG